MVKNFKILIVISYLILGVSAISFLEPVLHFFLFDERIICIVLPLLFLIFRKGFSFHNDHFWHYHQTFTIFLMISAPTLMLLEFFNSHNFVLNSIGVNYSRYLYFAITSILITLITKSQAFYLKYWKVLIFFFPLPIILLFVFIYLRNQQLYRWMISEDSLIEWSQFALIAGSSFLSMMLSIFLKKKDKFLAIVFLILSIGLFVVAGEEISWGQRILEIQTPKELAQRNLQEEITIHNIDVLFGLVYRGYMAIGLVGGLLWMTKNKLKKKLFLPLNQITNIFIPDWYLSIYFIIAFIYNFDRIYISCYVGESLLEEPMEFILMLAFFIFFLEKYIHRKNLLIIKKNEKNP